MNSATAKLIAFIDSDTNKRKNIMGLRAATVYAGHPHVHLEKHCRKFWKLPAHRLRGVDWLELSLHYGDEYQKSLGLPACTQTELPSNLGDATTCDLDKQ